MAAELKPGESFEGYQIIELIGEGAQAQVFKVKNVSTHRIEAMKILRSPLAEADPDTISRFQREIRICQNLNDPHIVGARAEVRHGGRLGLVMEFVDGKTLEEMLKNDRPLPLKQVIEISMQVLSALGYAHAKGVVHRDLKPANILVSLNGSVKVADFGISLQMHEARLTRLGVFLGTLSYAAPEQRYGEAEPRSDLFAVGKVLSEMLKARPDPEIPPELKKLAARATEYEADGRFESALEFAKKLAEVANLLDLSTGDGLEQPDGNGDLNAPRTTAPPPSSRFKAGSSRSSGVHALRIFLALGACGLWFLANAVTKSHLATTPKAGVATPAAAQAMPAQPAPRIVANVIKPQLAPVRMTRTRQKQSVTNVRRFEGPRTLAEVEVPLSKLLPTPPLLQAETVPTGAFGEGLLTRSAPPAPRPYRARASLWRRLGKRFERRHGHLRGRN